MQRILAHIEVLVPTVAHHAHDHQINGGKRTYCTLCKLRVFQKRVCFTGIKLYNHLPANLKNLSKETKLFKPALKRFLSSHSFYSVEEYLDYRHN